MANQFKIYTKVSTPYSHTLKGRKTYHHSLHKTNTLSIPTLSHMSSIGHHIPSIHRLAASLADGSLSVAVDARVDPQMATATRRRVSVMSSPCPQIGRDELLRDVPVVQAVEGEDDWNLLQLNSRYRSKNTRKYQMWWS